MPTLITRGAIAAAGFGFGAQTFVSGNTYTWVISPFNNGATGSFTVPAGVTSLTLEALGTGGFASTGAGGGGAAYAKSVVSVTPGNTVYWSSGAGTSLADTWANIAANSAPTVATNGVLAKRGTSASGSTGGAGGSAASSIGQVTYSGGAGGNGVTNGGGGGGGAAGPAGNGKNGGAGSNGLGAGGGGVGGASSSAGAAGSASVGGVGGNGPSGTGGGAGATSSTVAGYGTDGTGAGGGGGVTAKIYGGGGATYNYWGGGFGPGGGAGGGSGSATGGAVGQFGGGASAGVASSPVVGAGVLIVTFAASAATEISVGLGLDASDNNVATANIIAGVDTSGNTYLASTITVWTPSLLAYSELCTLSKISSNGTILWQKQIDALNGYYSAAVCDSSFNIYVAGNYYVPSLSTTKLFLLKYNSSGTLQWQTTYFMYGGINSTTTSMDIDSSGNIWTVGSNGGSIILAKFNSSGTALNGYSSYPSGFGAIYNAQIKTDSAGYLYVAINGDGYAGPCCCIYLIFQLITKFNLTGTKQWAAENDAQAYGGFFPKLLGITIDSSSNVYWGFSDTSYNQPVITKFNSSGTRQWTWRDASYSSTSGVYYNSYNSMQIDSSGVNYMSTNFYAGYNVIYSVNSSGTTVTAQKIDRTNGSIPLFYSIGLSSTNMVIATLGNTYSGITYISVPKTGLTNGTFGRNTVSNLTTNIQTANMTTGSHSLSNFSALPFASVAAGTFTSSDQLWTSLVGTI